MEIIHILIILVISTPYCIGYNYWCGKNDDEELVCICTLKSLRIIVDCKDSGLNTLPGLSSEEVRRIDLVIMSGTPYCGTSISRRGRVLCNGTETITALPFTGTSAILKEDVMISSDYTRSSENSMGTGKFAHSVTKTDEEELKLQNVTDRDSSYTEMIDTETTATTDDISSLYKTIVTTSLTTVDMKIQTDRALDNLTLQTPSDVSTDVLTVYISGKTLYKNIPTATTLAPDSLMHEVRTPENIVYGLTVIQADAPTTVLTDNNSGKTVIENVLILQTPLPTLSVLHDSKTQSPSVSDIQVIQSDVRTAIRTANTSKEKFINLIITSVCLVGVLILLMVRGARVLLFSFILVIFLFF